MGVSRQGAGDLRNHYQVVPTIFINFLICSKSSNCFWGWTPTPLPCQSPAWGNDPLYFPSSAMRSLPLLTSSPPPWPTSVPYSVLFSSPIWNPLVEPPLLQKHWAAQLQGHPSSHALRSMEQFPSAGANPASRKAQAESQLSQEAPRITILSYFPMTGPISPCHLGPLI